MVVRELVALLGVKTDASSVKKAENSLDGVKGALTKIAVAAAAAYGAIRSFLGFVNLASDANETLNVLNASFGRNKDAVIEWAAAFSKAAGRSEFDMREMAGTLGAVLNPLMEGNADAAAEMGMRLSELAVDLGSFFNAAEPDVLMALRSGITGEAEPLKRFGVVMSEATLANFAMNQGITKSIKSMTIAEKTALRYNFIVETTRNAHGDAAKTATGWANASKALMARLKDTGTRIGFFLLPVAEKAVLGFGKWIDNNEELIESIGKFIGNMSRMVAWLVKFVVNLPPAAKIGLLVIGFLKLAQHSKHFAKILRFLMTPMGKLFILVGLLVLIIDDLITWVEGGNSVFGSFFETLDELTGLNISEYIKNIVKWFMRLAEDPVAAVEEIFTTLEEFGNWVGVFFSDIWESVVTTTKEIWQGFLDWLWARFGALIEFYGGMWNEAVAVLEEVFAAVIPAIQSVWDFITSFVTSAADLLTGPFQLFLQFIRDVFEVGVVEAFNRLFENIKAWAGKIFGYIKKPFEMVGKWLGFGEGGGAAGAVAPGVVGARAAATAGAMGAGVIPGAARVAAARGGASLSQDTSVQVNMYGPQGITTKRAGEDVAAKLDKVLQRRNRAAQEALRPAAG